MQDIQSRIRQLKRPGLLVRAARFGLDDYRRTRDLSRLVPGLGTTAHGPVLIALLEAESVENSARQERATAYCLMRHIDLLTAVMAEARDFEAVTRPRDIT
ncbi:DUF6477 family protein [Loktanella sp. M215]|uniref:DUF6477 family protein n=1 Tax=Loktanella sp. M215 TaxID=2675431 RepID=UPI001F3D9DF7|nr:DUF6477 family protein [Loktanella sp. M215]MBU2359497.1 hypothetical protein [Alphaproteobacteria bacterium]MCF7700217.1 hypothetical protein [Loktanella sp. M215]